MSESSYRVRTQRLVGLLGVLGMIAGAIVLFWDSQRTFIVYEGSYEPLSDEQFASPWLFSTAALVGQLLLVLGFAVLCLSLGMLLARKTDSGARRRAGWVVIGLGVVLLLSGAGVLLWDATRVVEFGWFAYAPLSGTTFSSLTNSGAQICGKILLGLGAGVTTLGTGFKLVKARARRAV